MHDDQLQNAFILHPLVLKKQSRQTPSSSLRLPSANKEKKQEAGWLAGRQS